MPAPAVIDLSSLDGTNGFQIDAESGGDLFGRYVASAGDINGDGFDDLIIGADGADPGGSYSGAAYVVFGRASGFPVDINPAAFDGTNGFKISGAAAYDRAGRSVASAGDINGDGFDDLIVGAWGADLNGYDSGASYVVFGKASGFAANLAVTALDGTNGFRINGEAANDYAGFCVAPAGDVNGDGLADLIIGAALADPNGAQSGASYVVFGRVSGFGASFNLATLDGTNGFQINGEVAGDLAGRSVASAGDINGDGYGDLIIGAPDADPNGSLSGAAYVVFGRASGFAANLNLAALDGTDGFKLSGETTRDQFGTSVASAGDINGDGFEDIIVGAHWNDPNGSSSGSSYVVFGRASAFPADIALSSLDGASGFRIRGEAAYDYSGYSVASAGDINGDGFDDLIIGAEGSDPNGSFSGTSYVVFGRASGFGAALDLSALDGTSGFRINGETLSGRSGRSVASAGDVNGDGFDDLIIGAYATGTGGAQTGASHVVFGSAFGATTVVAGTAAADLLVGTTGADTLTGGGGLDVFRGGAGNDRLVLPTAAGYADIDGGTGLDTLAFSGGGTTLNLRTTLPAEITSIEAVDLTGSGNNTLVIDRLAALDLTEERVAGSAIIRVRGNAGDAVRLVDFGWEKDGSVTEGAVTYTRYVNDKAEVWVQNGVSAGVEFDLSILTGANGFRINGEVAGDFSGASVAAAGDINGDGFADVLIGAAFADPNGINSGASYVVFGRASGFAASLNLSALDGTNGFRITGEAAFDFSGRAIASAGDINGDGFDDLVIGANAADPNGPASGASYVVFGRASGFAADINLATIDGTNGFQINGAAADDRSGGSVASAGDVNGDGLADLIIGASRADPNGSSSGASYVVFGRTSGFGASLDLATLDGTNGFRINGAAADDYSGRTVASAGDINGDGYDDLIIGADRADPNGASSGASYVVFGRASGFAASLNLATLNGANGFRLAGEATNDFSGFSVASAGDINGDGLDDLIVGAYGSDANGSSAGASYVVFGRVSGFDATLNLSTLSGTNGFTIDGEAAGDYSGFSVASAGDINGDGFDDLIIGAHLADANGTDSGASYIVFGRASGIGPSLNLAALDGTTGFQVNGAAAADLSGRAVASAGDVNGDGYDDLLIGADGADPNGAYSGASYVLFGGAFGATTVVTGTAAADLVVGTTGADTLTGGGGLDVFRGGAGNDRLVLPTAAGFADIDGGTGIDTLAFSGAGTTLNLVTKRPAEITSIEAVDLTGSGNNTLVIDRLAVLDLTEERVAGSAIIRVTGNTGDQVRLVDLGWRSDGSVTEGAVTYTRYVNGKAEVWVQNGITASAEFNLSALDGANGFRINGEVQFDSSGRSVASAGDVNGDGFGDLIIGADGADPNGNSRSGASYVVFGTASGFGANLNLSTLDGTNGFQISGELAGDDSGRFVASAGDVNGDGFDDLVIGAERADPNSLSLSGASYVVFGQASGFAANLNLSTLNGTNGFKLNGEVTGDRSGRSVASAGDVNGDGFADVLIGAVFADPNGSASGASYVVFGQASGFSAALNLSALDGTNGFRINGGLADDAAGRSVASAGDVNGDGFDDLIIGADGADLNGSLSGASYVVFGKASGFGALLNVSTLDGTNGFRISGEVANDRSGYSVASAGDVNGDGFADLIIGAYGADLNGSYSGASYVVFGQASGFGANLNLSTLDGTTGFRISGEAAGDRSGYSVASAGDVNGDGFDDLIIGAYEADSNGFDAGVSYVVFGRASGFGANLNLSTLDGTAGLRISGEAGGGRSGRSVASAGDINGDGFDDLIIGDYKAGPNGPYSGASHVLFGSAFGATTVVTGTAAADLVIGTTGADTLTGGGGLDVFRGGTGNDRLVLPTAADFADIDGGTGFDTLALTGAGTTLDLTTTLPAEITSVEAVELTGSGNNTLALDRLAVLDLTEERTAGGTAILRVTGNVGDAVRFGDAGWSVAGTVTEGAVTFIRYVNDKAEVRIASSLWVELSGGADTLTGSQTHERIRGGAGADSIAGSLGGDNLRGGAENDTLSGDDSGDALYGDGGDDSLVGGSDAGNDSLDGGTGNDTMAGGLGHDRYFVDSLGDVVDESGGDGIDDVFTSVSFTLGAGVERAFALGTTGLVLTGNSLANRIFGSTGADSIGGEAGADDLRGDAGADTINGGEGADRFDGGLDNDSIAGGAGTFGDTLDGGAGDDTLAGGGGNDRYTVDAAGDVIDETDGSGGDAGGQDLVFAGVDVILALFVEDLVLTGAAVQGTGNGLANTMTGNALGNTLAGLGGADQIFGLGGDDNLDGGAANDRLYGAAGADTLTGGEGNDLLDGGADDDRLNGGTGRDTIRTGTGADTVVFSTAPLAGFGDTLTDFDVASDTLEISAAAFGGGLAAGNPVSFVSGVAPTAAGVTGGVFLYNTATGSLVFDANGDLAGGSFEIARFSNLAALSAADFSVVA